MTYLAAGGLIQLMVKKSDLPNFGTRGQQGKCQIYWGFRIPAVTLPDVQLIELTPQIAVASTKLSGNFHRDPADQIIVATAQVYNLELLTADERILKYDHICTV